jgi:hypothetical protein
MKQLILIPIIIIVTYVAQLFLPWWIITVICFVVGYFADVSKFVAFASSLLAIFVLWYSKAWMADGNFDEPMSTLLGNVFGGISGTAVLFLTAIVGGLYGGLGGLLGAWSRLLFSKK